MSGPMLPPPGPLTLGCISPLWEWWKVSFYIRNNSTAELMEGSFRVSHQNTAKLYIYTLSSANNTIQMKNKTNKKMTFSKNVFGAPIIAQRS